MEIISVTREQRLYFARVFSGQIFHREDEQGNNYVKWFKNSEVIRYIKQLIKKSGVAE